MTSETSKYRHLTTQFCQGDGLDIGSGGDPVVPSAIQIDLPAQGYVSYHGTNPADNIQLHCSPDALPFLDGSLDFVYSSHLIEDFEDWLPLLKEWDRVLKVGGHMVILLPDKELWRSAVAAGQPPNCAHKHEGRVGELSSLMRSRYDIIRDSLTNCSPGPHGIDYSILFVGQKRV